jgi:Flagellar motor switch protein FliM
MKKTPSEKEIDVIIDHALVPRDKPQHSDHRSIELCNFRNAGQMSERYARFMTNLFEAFARNSSNSLGAYLRSRFEMTLGAVEQMPVRDFWAEYREPEHDEQRHHGRYEVCVCNLPCTSVRMGSALLALQYDDWTGFRHSTALFADGRFCWLRFTSCSIAGTVLAGLLHLKK